MAYEPEWEWLHELPTELKGIVEYLAEWCDPDITKAKALGVIIITVVVIFVVDRGFKIMDKPRRK